MKKLLGMFLLTIGLQAMTLPTLAADKVPQIEQNFNLTEQTINTDNPAKIEVMELFWYGCPHCHHMEAPLNAWVKKLPADVYFKRVPALPHAQWAPMAKAYYAMESLGVLEKLHTPLFDAVHKTKAISNPTDEKAIIDWIVKQGGLDRVKVEEAFKSFSMNSQLNRAAMIFKHSGATGVPSLIIDGKYVTSSTMNGGNEQALKVADYIINNVRKDKAAAGAAPKK